MKKRIFHPVIVLSAILTLAASAAADTLVLRDGTRVEGYYEGGTTRVVRFQTPDGVREYDLLSVTEIRFGSTTPAPSNAGGIPAPPRSEATPAAASPTPATRPLTAPRGTSVVVRLGEGINSEEQRTGESFRATLADPLIVNGVEIAPQEAEVRGRIVEVEGAGRINGAAELRLELTEITLNGIRYALKTSEYQEVAESRGGQTATRVGAGAGIGALVGLLAGGGKGAAIGAGVGAGTAGAVQVLTKGEKLNIPAETLLEFTLSEPLMVPGR